MRHAPLLIAAALVFGVSGARAADAVSAADRSFVAMVSQGGLFEVKLGQVGEEQGSRQDIRDQGATEAHDHQLVGEALKSAATSAGIEFGDTLNAQFQKKLDGLKALSGEAFDAAYLRAMEDIHAKDGAAFLKESESGSNPRLKAFAAETHRIVERHIGELRAVGPTGK